MNWRNFTSINKKRVIFSLWVMLSRPMWGKLNSGLREIFACGIRNPTNAWNPSSADEESGIQCLESRIQDPRFPFVRRCNHITNFYGLFCRQARFDGAGLKFHLKCAAEFNRLITGSGLGLSGQRWSSVTRTKVIQSSNAPKERLVYDFVRPFFGKG